ncbi:MAG: LVIVD repeat-containing protein [Candidatus Heimdallarchaeota archaeon]
MTDIFVDGTQGWSTCKEYGVAFWDLSDLTDPDSGLYGIPTTEAGGIHCYEGYAYITEGSAGLRVYHGNYTGSGGWIAVESTFYDGSGWAYDVFVEDDYAYVADGIDGLEILDVTDPNALVEVGQYSDGSVATGVFVANDYAYVARGSDGIGIIDVSNPSSPIEVGYYTLLSECNRTFVLDETVYAADSDNGLEILQLSPDNDWDGLTNYEEVYIYNTNPYANDTDFDLLTDYQEIMIYLTDPLDADGDDDFLFDGEEILGLFAPTNPGANATGYVLTAHDDSDSDDDTFIDGIEIYYNTDPNNASSFPVPITITPPPETITETTTIEAGIGLIGITVLVCINLIAVGIIKRRKS